MQKKDAKETRCDCCEKPVVGARYSYPSIGWICTKCRDRVESELENDEPAEEYEDYRG
jgi:hypothetical protein